MDLLSSQGTMVKKDVDEALAHAGAAGAAVIYRHKFAALTRHAYPTMIVDYADLLASPMVLAADIARFGDLEPSPAELREAVDHLTNSAGPPPGGPVMQTA